MVQTSRHTSAPSFPQPPQKRTPKQTLHQGLRNGLFFKRAIAGALTTGLSLAIAHPAQAALLTWDVSFTTNGSQVGSGSFTLTTDSRVVPIGAPTDPSSPYFTGITVNNSLTNFNVVIQGIDWSAGSDPPHWIDSTSNQLKWLSTSRFGQTAAADGWFFGDPFLGTRQLRLDGSRATSGDRISGTWIQAIASPGLLTGGEWVASLSNAGGVPEPTTMTGMLVASGLGFGLRRRQRTNSISKH